MKLIYCAIIATIICLQSCKQNIKQTESETSPTNLKKIKSEDKTVPLPSAILRTNTSEDMDSIQFDTIIIDNFEYERKILFRKEMLFDHCRSVNITCEIDADVLLKHLSNDISEVYHNSLISDGLFTENELRLQLKELKEFIDNQLMLNNEFWLQCPDSSTKSKVRNILNDMNYGLYYILIWEYFREKFKQGNVRCFNKKLNSYNNKIFIESEFREGRLINSYFLDLDNKRFYGENLEHN